MAAQSSSSVFPEQFKPGPMYSFPKRKFGKGKDERSFRADWCDKYEWLHYDAETDAAFCYLFMRADHERKSVKNETQYSSARVFATAITAFKNTRRVNATVRQVEQYSLHQSTIGALLSKEHQKEQEINRKMLITILQNIGYLARQGLPLRGRNEDADSNFIQLLLLRSSDSPEIIEWMRKKTNKYTSPVIQNECLWLFELSVK